jgi:hypothetical protein
MINLAQANDSAAVQGPTGTWSVHRVVSISSSSIYRIVFDVPLGPPLEEGIDNEEHARARLVALSDLAIGDRWVIDKWGNQTALD